MTKDSFTLPGEAGYEKLTLELAKKWGADVIRDSDGTKLSDEITNSGYGIYSTICMIRADNEWAKQNTDKLQQNFLMSKPVIAEDTTIVIRPLDGYFTEQFVIVGDDSKEFWQVFDRTTGEEVASDNWEYDKESQTVTVKNVIKWHKYTVNFLATRIWEEISMYNHITNDWGDKEHLMAVEPRYEETREHILSWLDKWCQEHKETTVVRFTSMFYNFAWFWSDDPENRALFSDWGSYDFTVNPISLRAFEKEKGYKMTSEDFVNKGEYNSTHNAPTEKYRAWMDFINEFVVSFGKECVDLVHSYGKKAYVFYDDSWIGVEPYGERFADFGFDGIIKCVFNAFEARLCADVKGVETHELRFHPYLFPTGLTGEPTFAEGGNPKLDAQKYWVNVRRALLRKPVDRIGLGGYLHLVEPFPDFCDYIEEIADEFRMIKSFHEGDKPYTIDGKIAIISAWGSLRSWICSGHLHEHPEVDLTNIIESLAGLPVDVDFISFDDIVNKGIPSDVRLLINAGCKDSAWSGGYFWKNEALVSKITEFVALGGSIIGVNEPSAVDGDGHAFRLNHLFGIDRDNGTKKCLLKRVYSVEQEHYITKDTADIADSMKELDGIYIEEGSVKVLGEKNNLPVITVNDFGKGKAMYMSSYRFTLASTRMLFRAILHLTKREDLINVCVSSDLHTECTYYKNSDKLVVTNNTGESRVTDVNKGDGKSIRVELKAFETMII